MSAIVDKKQPRGARYSFPFAGAWGIGIGQGADNVISVDRITITPTDSGGKPVEPIEIMPTEFYVTEVPTNADYPNAAVGSCAKRYVYDSNLKEITGFELYYKTGKTTWAKAATV